MTVRNTNHNKEGTGGWRIMTTVSMFHATVPPSEYLRNYSRMIRRPYVLLWRVSHRMSGRPTRTTTMHSLNTLWTAILPGMLSQGIWRGGGRGTCPARSAINFLVLPLYSTRTTGYFGSVDGQYSFGQFLVCCSSTRGAPPVNNHLWKWGGPIIT